MLGILIRANISPIGYSLLVVVFGLSMDFLPKSILGHCELIPQ